MTKAPGAQSPTQGEKGWSSRLANGDRALRVHLIGIGGAGLSAIASVLLEMGMQVSGSDNQFHPRIQELAAAGAVIFPGQTGSNLTEQELHQSPDVVLISSAIRTDNPEYRAAAEMGIPVVKRKEFLAALLARRGVIAVAGTAGKSTTTAMAVQVLQEAGLNPGYIMGAQLPGYGTGSAGKNAHFVIEADEYDHMFLGLYPHVAIITNVEWDHPDCYPTPASFRRAFMQFIDTVDRNGLVISCGDDAGAEELRVFGASRRRWNTYGLDSRSNLRATALYPQPDGSCWASLVWQGLELGEIRPAVPGRHNLLNALAALSVALDCGVDPQGALLSLAKFRGIARRFELKGEEHGVTVIDDYAHHPTKVMATLSAARSRYPQRRIWAVFQPHTYSRTRHLLAEMANSFMDADQVIITDIFASREVADGATNSAQLVAASRHPAISHIPDLRQAAETLATHVTSGDVVITLGAGDCYRVGEMLLEWLRAEPVAHGPE